MIQFLQENKTKKKMFKGEVKNSESVCFLFQR